MFGTFKLYYVYLIYHLTVCVHQEGEIVIGREHISVFQPFQIKNVKSHKLFLCNQLAHSPIPLRVGSACRLPNQIHSIKADLTNNMFRTDHTKVKHLTTLSSTCNVQCNFYLVILVLPILMVLMQNQFDK